MKCPKCNAEVAESTKFCPECGEKMPVTANQAPASESKPPVTPTPLVPDQKSKKKKTKKIIIISAGSVLLCGILFLVLYLLNPSCIFGHRGALYTQVEQEVSCTKDGYHIYRCEDCDDWMWAEVFQKALGHNYETAVCGQENTCLRCGEKTLLEHEVDYSFTSTGIDHCMHCGQARYTVILPTAPITVNNYDSRDNIEETIVITELTYSDREIEYKVTRTYHEDGANTSALASFAWKLYAPDGTVVSSGTEYSDASIKMGEQCKGSFSVFHMEEWTEYTLEIIHIG